MKHPSPATLLTTAGAVFVAFSVTPAFAQKKDPTEQAVILGQFGDWGAYTATPGGKKACFVLSKPTSAVTDPPGRSRDASYAFITTRPTDKVTNEVSVVVGYPQKPNHDASATVDGKSYVLYTQNEGAWVKNAGDETLLVDAMRKGATMIIQSESGRGTKTTDTYSLRGVADALDKVAAECK